jgi:hypothetical protein
MKEKTMQKKDGEQFEERNTETKLSDEKIGFFGANLRSEIGFGNRVSRETYREADLVFEKLVWMNSAEAAAYLRKSYGALRVMVCRGHIKPKVFHRRWYFRRTELDRLIESSV